MLKFFRTIRKKLIEQGKTANYFKYAIGEIVLVVIGILIALQVNNWNEDKKLKSEEIKTLKVIRDGIAQDTTMLNSLRIWLSLSEEGIKNVNSVFAGEKPSDSLGFYLNLSLIQADIKLNKAPFESLKAFGPNIITNDSLRNAIFYFYEYSYQFIENSNEQITIPNKMLLTHSIDWFENVSIYDRITERSWFARSLVPHDIDELKNDKRFLTLLNTKLTNIQYQYHFSYTQGLKTLTRMLEALDKEINQLEDD